MPNSASFADDLLALDNIDITGDSALPGPFPVAEAAARSIAAAHRQAALLGAQRGLMTGRVRITRRAAAAAFRSERYLSINGAAPVDPWSPLSGYYEANDGWVQLHTNYAHHRDAVLRVLDTPDQRDKVAATIKTRSRFEIEDTVLAEGGCAFAYRSRAEWEQTAQALALETLPLLDLTRFGDAPPQPIWRTIPVAGRPLSGIRVLDLTHIIAGPVCTRILAAYGATVTRVSASHLPTLQVADIDTGFGKQWVSINLAIAEQRNAFMALVRQADVVVLGFRPGAFEALGVGPAHLFAQNPGLVIVSLSAWSHAGPWATRRGFDSLVQTATGIAYGGRIQNQESRVKNTEYRIQIGDEKLPPLPLPAQALDHATGYLMAAAAMAALGKQQREGGAWHIRASLAQTGRWLWHMPRIAVAGPDLGIDDVADLRMHTATPYGAVHHLGPVGTIEGVRLGWDCPPPMKPV